MKLSPALLMLCAATAASANPFPNGNAASGQKLFEQYKCNRCHEAMQGGDGNTIFTRADRLVHTAAELETQMEACSSALSAKLTPQEKQHLGAYLNRYYHLQ